MVTTPVAPSLMYVYDKHGYELLAEVLYDEPNEIFNITPEERVRSADFLNEFRGTTKPGVVCICKDLRVPSPVDPRRKHLLAKL